MAKDGWVTLYEMLRVTITRHTKNDFMLQDEFRCTTIAPTGIVRDDEDAEEKTYTSLSDVLRDGWEPLSPWEPKGVAGVEQTTFWFKRRFDHLDVPDTEDDG